MSPLSLVFGMLVGFSLGLAGGGGALLAVPLLVYGLNIPAREAIGVSLVTVGTTALVGLGQRTAARMVEFPTGVVFAIAGMITAPLGAWLAHRVPESLTLVAFGSLMLAIAARMWQQASKPRPPVADVPLDDNRGPTCHRDPQGQLRLTSRCALVLMALGLAVGVLTGLFGVGGGFIIVPALVAFTRMGMQRAVGTSLLVVTLVSLSGIASHFLGGNRVPVGVTLVFLLGSVAGLFAGTAIAALLPGSTLQKGFAVAIVGVGLFVIVRSALS